MVSRGSIFTLCIKPREDLPVDSHHLSYFRLEKYNNLLVKHKDYVLKLHNHLSLVMRYMHVNNYD